jgi:hypothetical protein
MALYLISYAVIRPCISVNIHHMEKSFEINVIYHDKLYIFRNMPGHFYKEKLMARFELRVKWGLYLTDTDQI